MILVGKAHLSAALCNQKKKKNFLSIPKSIATLVVFDYINKSFNCIAAFVQRYPLCGLFISTVGSGVGPCRKVSRAIIHKKDRKKHMAVNRKGNK